MTTTTSTDTTTRPLCCYEGCGAPALWRDADGDPCCERCYWEGAHFVELRWLDGSSFDEDLARRYARMMSERGWSVTVREPAPGEAEGYYYELPDGTLQVLGFSIPVPVAYRDDSVDCYDAACAQE
jgi:hypothetical protein